MDTGFNGYGDVLSALGLGTPQRFQVWYERYLKNREVMLTDMDGFSWDRTQLDFSYSFAEVTDTVTAMADYVDRSSSAVARGREVPIRKIEGYIPRQKRYETRDEDDARADMIAVRDLKAAAEMAGESPYSDIEDYFSKNLLEYVGQFPESHAQSITYQVGQMKSDFGLELTDANNPNGIIGVKFRANVPDENTHTGLYYTIGTDGQPVYDETKNPIKDINSFLQSLLFDGTYGTVEVEADEMSFLMLMGHPVFKRAIGYLAVTGLFTATTSQADADARALEAGANVLLVNGSDSNVMVGYFKRIFPKVSSVKLHNNVVAVAKLNEETKLFEYPLLKAFNEHIMLFRPTGDIGTIKNVAPIRSDASAVYQRMFGGRGLIEYYYDPRTKTQTWESELTALAVPNRPKKLHRFIIGKTEAGSTGASLRSAARRKTSTAETLIEYDGRELAERTVSGHRDAD